MWSAVTEQAQVVGAAGEFVESLQHSLGRDDRVIAAWLEGSRASGEVDVWSDIDLHLAVDDADFAALSSDEGLRALVEPVAPVLGSHRIPFGPNMVLLNATVVGPHRLDLYVERASACPAHPRLVPPVVLFDHTGLTASFRIEPESSLLPPAFQLMGLINRYAYGFMWPSRLLGRRNDTTALMNATIIAHEFLVPAMLAQERPEQMHRELLSSERFLSPKSRARLEAIVDDLASGYLARSIDDCAPLARAHTVLVESILTELRAACALHNVDWPDRTEREIRSYLRTTIDLDL